MHNSDRRRSWRAPFGLSGALLWCVLGLGAAEITAALPPETAAVDDELNRFVAQVAPQREVPPLAAPSAVTPPPIAPSQIFQPEEQAFDLGAGVGFGTGYGANYLMAGGYIDNAQVRNIFRLRYDAGFDLNRPDRAEYFYASWANLTDHAHAIRDTNQLVSAVNNRGPIRFPEQINYQDISPYLEWVLQDRLSIFSEIPMRFVDFVGDADDPDAFETPAFRAAYARAPTRTAGLSDIQFGLKYALSNDPDQLVTAQFRSYVPTGNSREGLGTGHVSLEPGLLLYQRIT